MVINYMLYNFGLQEFCRKLDSKKLMYNKPSARMNSVLLFCSLFEFVGHTALSLSPPTHHGVLLILSRSVLVALVHHTRSQDSMSLYLALFFIDRKEKRASNDKLHLKIQMYSLSDTDENTYLQ